MRSRPRRNRGATARPALLHGAAIASLAAAAAITGCGGSGSKPPIGSIGPSKPATVDIGHNVVRIPGTSADDVAAAAVLAQYGEGGESQPAKGWILVRENAWREAMLAAEFAAKPVSAAILPIKTDWIPPGPADALRRAR